MFIQSGAITAVSPARSLRLALRDRELGLAMLGVALAVGLAARFWVAFNDDGIYWPDEVFQALEPAHRLVFGYGRLPWEYVDGARSWAFPGALAGVLKVLQLVGLDSPREYIPVLRGLFCALGVLTAYGAFRLARVLGASIPAAAAGAAIFALSSPMIYFGPRGLSETVSAAPIVWAFALALREGAGRRTMIAAASLLGIAVLIRLQNGVFCLGLLAILAGRRQWADVRLLFAGLCVWAAIFGLLDWATWGRPFHSALVYLKFNLIDGKASDFGTAPPLYYVRTLFTAMPLLALSLCVFGRAGYARTKGLTQVAVAAFLLLWFIPHKEFRFIVPVLPLFCATAAVGMDVAGRRLSPAWGARALALAVCAAGLVSAAGVGRLTFWNLGQPTAHRPISAPAIDYGGSANRLMMTAGEQPDLCGLHVAVVDLAWTGGQSLLHRPVPIHTESDTAGGSFNYAVAPRDPGQRRAGLEGEVVAADGAMALIRLSRPRCRS